MQAEAEARGVPSQVSALPRAVRRRSSLLLLLLVLHTHTHTLASQVAPRRDLSLSLVRGARSLSLSCEARSLSV